VSVSATHGVGVVIPWLTTWAALVVAELPSGEEAGAIAPDADEPPPVQPDTRVAVAWRWPPPLGGVENPRHEPKLTSRAERLRVSPPTGNSIDWLRTR